jgi:c-di-GMP-binding flagellar brake protein YcgR
LFSRNNNDPFIVSIEEDRRESFRVEPPIRGSLWARIGRHWYHVKDIGAGGVAIYRKSGEIPIETNKTYSFQITLPLLNEVIMGTIKVVDSSWDAYHCEFIDLSEEEREKLHLFVLERQKEELRKSREDRV